MVGFDTTVEERRVYKIYQKGLYCGQLVLTPSEVRKMTAEAVYILVPVK